MDFEEQLNRSLFKTDSEKTYIDKILSRQDVDRVRELIRKKNLEREDVLEMLYLLSSNESKLLNFGEWDRYVILKFFVWIREFVKIAELLYDYQDDLKAKENKGELTLSARSKKLLKNNERFIEHNAKFLIDLYFNICRSTMSLGATGFMELLKNKYEVVYPAGQLQTPVDTNHKRGFLRQ